MKLFLLYGSVQMDFHFQSEANQRWNFVFVEGIRFGDTCGVIGVALGGLKGGKVEKKLQRMIVEDLVVSWKSD
jgi:hypothetical protein